MLTRRQHDLLVFIRDYMAESGGVSPSYEEMMDAMGYASKSRIHFLIKNLEEREFIRHMPQHSRSIEILKSPDGVKVGRHQFTDAEIVEIVLRQLAEGYYTTYTDADGIEGTTLACAISRDPILPGDKIIKEHMTALGLGGKDDVSNVRIVLEQHAAKKTNEGLNSDKKRIAKVKRLQNPKKPKGTIKSRGFDKGLKKKMSGEVVRR